MASMTLTGSDECSGTTIMNDGTKVYWAEGPGNAIIVHPDGKIEVVDAWSKHPVLLMPEIMSIQTDLHRRMTKAEEAEWNKAMRFYRSSRPATK